MGWERGYYYLVRKVRGRVVVAAGADEAAATGPVDQLGIRGHRRCDARLRRRREQPACRISMPRRCRRGVMTLAGRVARYPECDATITQWCQPRGYRAVKLQQLTPGRADV